MARRAIGWLVGFLARWQDRYTVLDNRTAHTFAVRGSSANVAGGVYRPVRPED